MISFKKYTDIVGDIAKKLKVSKDKAVNALIKAQERGINPLKWQQNLSLLTTFATLVAEYDPVDERMMTDKQKLVQIQHYWDDLDHMASDDTKKKSMQRLGYKNIKLDSRGKITSFDEERDYKDEYKKFQSSDKMKKYRAELNKYNREKGTYGNGDGKDASHKNGKMNVRGLQRCGKTVGRIEARAAKEKHGNGHPQSGPRKLKRVENASELLPFRFKPYCLL